MTDLNDWIPARARIAHELRAEADPSDPIVQGGEKQPGDAEAQPEPTWEESLTKRLNEAISGGDDAEAEPGPDEAAAVEAPAAVAGEEPAAEAADGALEEGEAEGAQDGDEGGADAGDPGTDDGESPILRFPGRHEADPDIEIPLTPEQLEAAGIDPRTFVERQNQLRNGYMRGQEVRAAQEALRTQRGELDWIADQLRERPTEFVAAQVDKSLYPDLVRSILLRLDGDDYEAMVDQIAQLDRDEASRLKARIKLQEEERARDQQHRQQGANTQFVNELQRQIASLVPEDMDNDRADEFFEFAVHKLERWYRQQPKGTRVEPGQVPALLQQLGALTPYGLSPEGGAGARTDDAPTTDARRTTRPVDPALAKRAEETGKDLRKRKESRKRAAATAPAGVGSAAAADAMPPRGQSFDERMAWLKKRLGK